MKEYSIYDDDGAGDGGCCEIREPQAAYDYGTAAPALRLYEPAAAMTAHTLRLYEPDNEFNRYTFKAGPESVMVRGWDDLARKLERARADAAAGRVVSQTEVAREHTEWKIKHGIL